MHKQNIALCSWGPFKFEQKIGKRDHQLEICLILDPFVEVFGMGAGPGF